MIDETLFEAEEKMEKAVEVAKEDFAGIRTGRATPGLFNKLVVGTTAPPPRSSRASFTTPEARTILIKPFDTKAMHNIERAIRDSDLGSTEQRRRGHPVHPPRLDRGAPPRLHQKLAHHKAEEGPVAIRNIRRKGKTDLEHAIKDGDIGETTGARGEGARPVTKKRMSTPSTGCSSTRRPRTSRSGAARPTSDDDLRAGAARTAGSRAGRNLRWRLRPESGSASCSSAR